MRAPQDQPQIWWVTTKIYSTQRFYNQSYCLLKWSYIIKIGPRENGIGRNQEETAMTFLVGETCSSFTVASSKFLLEPWTHNFWGVHWHVESLWPTFNFYLPPLEFKIEQYGRNPPKHTTGNISKHVFRFSRNSYVSRFKNYIGTESRASDRTNSK